MTAQNRYREICTVTLVAAACAGLTPALVSAAEIITPTAATSTTTIGGSRTIDYTIDGSDLSAGGSSGDILTETHDQCTDSAGYWLSGDGAGTGTTEVLAFTLPAPADVDAVHLWTYWRGTDNPTRGIKTFDISFSTDDGSTYPTTITGATLGDFLQGDATAAQSDNETAVQTKTFAAQSGVTHIKLTNIINFGNAYIGMSEIRFGGSGGTAVTLGNTGATNITSTSASVYSTLSGTNANVTVYWKPGNITPPFSFTGWEGTNGPGLESTGVVTRSIPLASEATYTVAFYATNAATGTADWDSTTLNNSTILVYEGFLASASGADDAYVYDGTLAGASDFRTGMVGSWDGDLLAGEVDYVARNDNMTYPNFNAGDQGVVEYYTTRDTDQNKGLVRSLSYEVPGTRDFYIILAWATADPIAHGIQLSSSGLPDVDLAVGTNGSARVTFGGSLSDDYSGGTAHMDGNWNLLIIRAIDTPNTQSTLYYDAYELWLNPTIAIGSGEPDQLGTPDAIGDASLRDNNGSPVNFSSISLSATLQSPETIKFDELRITTDLSSILGSPPAGTVLVIR